MRVKLLILILLTPIFLLANKRDSVYNVVFSNYSDSLIYSSFRDTYPNIRGEDWAEDLFNDVIKSYSSADKDKYEYDTYVVFLTYTDLYKNNDQLKKFLPRLNELSNKFENYRYYFRAWEMIIKYDVVFDRTEYALIQADLMKKEAQRLNFEEGIILSDLIKTNVYTTLNKDENVIDITASIISRDNVPYRDLLLAYLYQATAYIGLNDFDNAEITLDYAKELNENEIKNGGAIYRNHLAANVMYVDLLMAEVYLNSKKIKKLGKELENIEKNLSINIPMSHLYKFHYLKGKYHSAIKEWQTSINNYDSLLFRANHFGVNGRVFISLNLLKSEALYNNGNKMEAAMLLDSLYLASDSILSNMIQVQEKILAQNYIMNKALVRAESIKTFFSITSIVGVVLLILMLSFLIFKTIILLRKIDETKSKIRYAFNTASANNKLKEVFIENIRDKIKIPLAEVVLMSDNITSGDSISKEALDRYAVMMESNTNQLLEIINGVLDLSRLEAGMAKFNIQEFDVVESLKRSISSNVSIFSNIDHYVVTTDQERLKTLILFLLPKNNSNFAKIEINIIPDNNLLEILIINIDPEINTSAESNINNINYEVNKLVAKLLNWDFNIFNLDSQRSARILIK